MNQIRGFVRRFSALPLDKMPGPRGVLGVGNLYNYIKPFGEIRWKFALFIR